MVHAQKPFFVFRRNGRVRLNRRGASVQSTTGSLEMRIRGTNAGYTMFRGSVKGTGYPLHSPVSPSLPLQCVTVCHHISTGLYLRKRMGRYSLVGIASRYGPDGPEIESQWERDFPSGVQAASYTMSTGSLPGAKRPGCGVDHPPSSSAEVKEKVELYIYSLSVPSYPVIG
jgi:hypothetical protein